RQKERWRAGSCSGSGSFVDPSPSSPRLQPTCHKAPPLESRTASAERHSARGPPTPSGFSSLPTTGHRPQSVNLDAFNDVSVHTPFLSFFGHLPSENPFP